MRCLVVTLNKALSKPCFITRSIWLTQPGTSSFLLNLQNCAWIKMYKYGSTYYNRDERNLDPPSPNEVWVRCSAGINPQRMWETQPANPIFLVMTRIFLCISYTCIPKHHMSDSQHSSTFSANCYLPWLALTRHHYVNNVSIRTSSPVTHQSVLPSRFVAKCEKAARICSAKRLLWCFWDNAIKPKQNQEAGQQRSNGFKARRKR